MTAYRLGLTGGIGMGKSTTADMFAELGVPVWDADAAVRELYAAGQPGAQAIAALFPDAVEPDGSISRPRLRTLVGADPGVLDRLNAAIHPLVAADRARFLAQATADIVLLDIPLLFETGADALCDGVVVVSAPAEVQRDRVLARGMSEAEFQAILSRQMPDSEKRARATWVIEGLTLDSARAAVKGVLDQIRKRDA